MRHLLTASTAMALILAAPAVAVSQTKAAQPAGQAQTAPAGGAGSQNFLDQAAVEKRLETRGFDDVDVELDGQNYTGSADWYGEKVDLTVSASTGRVIEPDKLTSDQIRAKLEDDGYEDVSDVQEAGDEYTAKAKRLGEEMKLRVDASRGHIVDPRELSKDQVETRLDDEGYSKVVVFERDSEYGNFYAKAEKEDDVFLLEVNPLSGRIMAEREES